VDLSIMARLLLLHRPLLVLVDDADRFLTAVPRLPEVVARLRQQGAAVLLTATASTVDGLRAALPPDVQCLVLDGGRLKPAA
jgi:2-C-methyl-D-erythritol 4-phosphate cytidylyltransferase